MSKKSIFRYKNSNSLEKVTKIETQKAIWRAKWKKFKTVRCVNAKSFKSQNESKKHRRTKKESEKGGKETLLTDKDAHKQYSFPNLY